MTRGVCIDEAKGVKRAQKFRPTYSTADWTDVGRAGTVYYMDDEGRPRGVLLWNRFGHVDTARDLIRAARPIETTEHVA